MKSSSTSISTTEPIEPSEITEGYRREKALFLAIAIGALIFDVLGVIWFLSSRWYRRRQNKAAAQAQLLLNRLTRRSRREWGRSRDLETGVIISETATHTGLGISTVATDVSLQSIQAKLKAHILRSELLAIRSK